ncbi:MAG: carboxypeptidase-like regulatory domain-containing protein [Steroidobacteraceae bacterium]
MKTAIIRALVFVGCGLASAGVGFAQGAGGSISGKLIDANGAPITLLEAAVSVRNTKTDEVTIAALLPTGEYSITGLAPGVYDLNIPIACCMYHSYEQKSITLRAGQALKQDLDIAWGINLGTIGDDPGQLGMDMRTRAGQIEGPTPRMADGKVDFNGIWYNVPPPMEVRTAQLPPMQPWALDIHKQMQKLYSQGPQAYCLPQHAIPTALLFPYKVVQTRDLMVHLTEFTTPGYRQVFMDGRPHPPADEWNPAWMGHSVGHWEGDTLVIDTTGFNEVTPGFGIHTEKLHVIERWSRPSRGKLEVAIVATDPDAWTGEFRMSFTAGLVPNEEILEFVCPENNVDPLHFGGLGWKGRP